MNTRHVSRIDDPQLDIFRRLKQTNRTRYSHLFVVEGATVCKRLLASDFEVQSILATPQRLAELETIVPPDTQVLVIEKSMASELVGFQFHLGILAAGVRKTMPRPGDILPPAGASLVLVGDRMIDQQNVGMLIRIGSAFGASVVIFGPGSADPFSRRVMRVSMGNGLFMPVIEVSDMSELTAELTSLRYDLCATVLSEHAEELSTSDLHDRTALVFGNETHGLADEVRSSCHRQLTISMLNGTDSLNVAIATGIFAHSYRMQHPALQEGVPCVPTANQPGVDKPGRS